MNRTLLISLVVAGVLVLALAGWIYRGVRWTVRPARGRRRLVATPRFG